MRTDGYERDSYEQNSISILKAGFNGQQNLTHESATYDIWVFRSRSPDPSTKQLSLFTLRARILDI